MSLQRAVLFAYALSLVVGDCAYASYEKANLFSAKRVGAAGAGAAAATRGSDSLYFNPAGISGTGEPGTGEASLNLSPTVVSTKGPVLANNVNVDGKNSVLPMYGVFGSYKVSEKFAVGLGSYVAGGSAAVAENLGLPTPFNTRPNVRSQINIIEYSLGASYELAPGFRVGGAWRVVSASARFESPVVLTPPSVTTPTAIALNIDGLSQTKFNGVRLGMQYEGETFGVGAMWRSGLSFTLQGTANGTAEPAGGAITPLANFPASAQNDFPNQFALSGYVDLMEGRLRVLSEWSYTLYSVNQNLALSSPAGSPLNLSALALPQQWINQHIARVGFEYRGVENWVYRAGYTLTGQSVPKGLAKATFPAPGIAHSVATGVTYTLLEKALDLDFAIDYGFVNASVTASDIASPTTFAGDYSQSALAMMAGATYRF